MNKFLLFSLIALCGFSTKAQEPKENNNLILNPSFEETVRTSMTHGGWKLRRATGWKADLSIVSDKKYVTHGAQGLSYKVTTKGTKNITHQIALGRQFKPELFDVTKDYDLQFDMGTDVEATYEIGIVYHLFSKRPALSIVVLKDQKSVPGKMTTMKFKVELSKLGIDPADFKDVEIWIRMAFDSNIGKTFYFDNFYFYTGSFPTAVQDYWKSELKVYPNPTSELLYLQSESPIQNVEVFNILGTKVMSVDHYQEAGMNISSLDKGQYFLRAKTAKGTVSHKFIVK
ncbi:T9SS type A sorting domain-containing protein [Halosquirtibacter laminarini]|uniref:T9SS type A sorting domain-containing protein n=1 Tax=Halosquirtibacter laminarini TaxID=3374600 RepID=A0AC61NNV9_9BACT|nr:T9SS type A sorting domain-containing protein [Prolixibacteraceae bacterium]